MRKILFLVLLCFWGVSVSAAQDVNFEEQAERIYDVCDKKTSLVDDKDVLTGNIADVEMEKKLRQCLKDETVKVALTFMSASETEDFRKALNGLESESFELYKAAIFCKKDGDKNWCVQYYKDNASLENLRLEKSITSQVMKVLVDMLEIKQDDV